MVRSGLISDRINDILQSNYGDENDPQRCSTWLTKSAELLKVEIPNVPLEVDCLPAEATTVASYYCRSLPSGQTIHQHEGSPMKVGVDAGVYQLDAIFGDQQYTNVKDEIVIARPPFVKKSLECADE